MSYPEALRCLKRRLARAVYSYIHTEQVAAAPRLLLTRYAVDLHDAATTASDGAPRSDLTYSCRRRDEQEEHIATLVVVGIPEHD